MKFNSVLSNLKNYEAGKPIELVVREYGINGNDVIKLASNENPFGTSPLVIDILKDSAKYASLYPDDSYFELKQALADKFNISARNLIIGAGSDQIIEFVSRALLNEKRAILTAGVTFAMYEIYARQMGADVIKTDSLTHDLAELYELYKKHKDKIGIIFLCIPNNPLGECLDKDEVFKFIQNISDDTLVVVDGAYNDFAKFKDAKKAIEPLGLITKFKNSIFLGTFSKSYGLGGMRVGYGIANDDLICELGKLRSPFNITTLSLKAAIYALKDDEFVLDCIKSNFEQMKRYESLASEVGVEYIPSYTNFITFKFHLQSSDEIGKNLLKKGIILRNLNSYGLNAIRITIGTQRQNDRVLEELRDILK